MERVPRINYLGIVGSNLNILYMCLDKPEVVVSMGQTLNPDRIKSGDDVYFECSIDAKPRAHKIAWLFNVSSFYTF